MFKYDFGHKYRGTALIIGNEFNGERKGCSKDVDMAYQLFKRLDFNVRVFMNLSATQMKEKMTQASKDKNNEFSDCFVLVLSSHGEETMMTGKELPAGFPKEANVWKHGILGEDAAPVYVDEIVKIFNDDNSYRLKEKPRLFFIQACKSRSPVTDMASTGDSYDAGFVVKVSDATKTFAALGITGQDNVDSARNLYDVDLSAAEDIYTDWEKDETALLPETISENASQVTDHDAAGDTIEEIDTGASGDSGQIPMSPFDIVPIKCPNDFLIMYPVMSGKLAFRNSLTGSYMIKFLYENLTKLHNGCNLLQYLTYVCNNMAEYEYKPNLANISTDLSIRLKFFRKHLKGTIKHLSSEENQEKLVTIIGEEHRVSLKGDPTIVEPKLHNMIENTLSEGQMMDIMKAFLPFKMTACVVHRLTDSVSFEPKKDNSFQGIVWKSALPKPTSV